MNSHTLHRSLHPLILCALTAWSCAYACVSLAREPEVQTRSTIVRFSDLNLSNPEGVAALYKRIKVAAHRVCTGRSVRTRWSKADAQCKREAIAKAVGDMQNERLASLHRKATHWRDG
jgi:UrcA family protein